MNSAESDGICAGCGRRNFLCGLLAVAGAQGAAAHDIADVLAALPGPTPPGAIPDKKGAVKVRLVFAAFGDVQPVKTWPYVEFDFRPVMKNVLDALNAGVKGVEFVPGRAGNPKAAAKIVADDAKTGDVKGYLVIQMNNWVNVVGTIVRTGRPVLFCSFPYSGIGGWNTQNAEYTRGKRKNYASISSVDFNDTIGAARAFELLKDGTGDDFVRSATAYRLAHTPPESGVRPSEGPLACLSPEETLAAVKGRKILSVEKCRPAEKAKILKDFGIVVEDVSFAEVNAAYDRAPLDLARAKVAEWKRTARKVAGVSDETLLGSARMFYGMKNLLKERGASAISINCLGGCYHGKLKAYPCLGFMELQDLGLFGTCENDIRSTVTMMVFSAMTKGRMGYISDPCIDSSRRAVIFAHCVSTRKFLGVGDAAAPYEIETHCADRQGASVRTFAPKNMPVTTVQLHFGGGDVKGGILVQPGCIIGNDPDDRGCRTKIVAEMKGDFELVYRYWHTWGWHRVTFLGDFAKDAEALAKKLGYVCVHGM